LCWQYISQNGQECAKYTYDAWGNHKVLVENNGEYIDISNNIDYNNHIGNINPFRYRGYYFDTETGLYYLNTRYYDPTIGRFINADEITILDELKSDLHGLNLYMYCGNNPVMMVDPSGRFFISALIVGLLIGFTVGAVTSGVKAVNDGYTGVEALGIAVLGGLVGAVLGASVAVGAGAVVGAFSAGVFSASAAGIAFGATVATNFVVGSAAYAADKAIRGESMDWHDPLVAGAFNSLRGAINFGMGMVLGVAGYHAAANTTKSVFKGMVKAKMMSKTIISNFAVATLFAPYTTGLGWVIEVLKKLSIGDLKYDKRG